MLLFNGYLLQRFSDMAWRCSSAVCFLPAGMGARPNPACRPATDDEVAEDEDEVVEEMESALLAVPGPIGPKRVGPN